MFINSLCLEYINVNHVCLQGWKLRNSWTPLKSLLVPPRSSLPQKWPNPAPPLLPRQQGSSPDLANQSHDRQKKKEKHGGSDWIGLRRVAEDGSLIHIGAGLMYYTYPVRCIKEGYILS